MNHRILVELVDQCGKSIHVDELYGRDEVRLRTYDMGTLVASSRFNKDDVQTLISYLQDWLGHQHYWIRDNERWVVCRDCGAVRESP